MNDFLNLFIYSYLTNLRNICSSVCFNTSDDNLFVVESGGRVNIIYIKGAIRNVVRFFSFFL